MNEIELKIKQEFQKAIYEAFNYEFDINKIIVELPKEQGHGDYALNVAMQLSKELKNNPKTIAQEIIAKLDLTKAGIASVEIAGPGFINLTMKMSTITNTIQQILKLTDNYGSSNYGQGIAYNIEFVSANPTGDLHPGHARGAAMGDSIARILKFAGYQVTKEYYINDAGNQITNMAKSLEVRYKQALNMAVEMIEDGYYGEDLILIGQKVAKADGDKWLDNDAALEFFREYGMAAELAKIKADLAAFNVEFDVYASELSLYKTKMIEKTLNRLAEKGMTYSDQGALWLKTTNYGDDKDRVLVKSDGSYTYLTPDIAYHLDKFERGYHKLVNLLGADHHGYIIRLKAGIAALGYPSDDLCIDIIQMVRLLKSGQEYKLSKRTGNSLSLRDLIEEAGVDALRYFFVSRAADTHMDLDLDVITRQTNENPVYYVQYAHARMCAILRNVGNYTAPKEFNLLTHPKELALIKQLNEFPNIVQDAAVTRMPHKLGNYLQKVATLFHSFYSECKCICDDLDLQNQRIALVKASQITTANALNLIGVVAVERM